MWEAHPHIGTDYLMRIAIRMRNHIRDLGSSFVFGTRLEEIESGGSTARFRLRFSDGSIIATEYLEQVFSPKAMRSCRPAALCNRPRTDISQDKRREESLLNTNERMSSIINNAPVMLAFCDQNGKFEWTNDLWVRELGWPVKSMNTAELFENLFSDPVQRDTALDFLHRADASWQDFSVRTQTNTCLHTSWAAVPLSNGRKIVICQNINARKILEIENEKTRSRLDLI
jgi:PAS domain-containing protein